MTPLKYPEGSGSITILALGMGDAMGDEGLRTEDGLRLAPARRLLELAVAMSADSRGLSLRDIQDRFRVSRKTAERMRAAVLDLFPGRGEFEQDGKTNRWRLRPGTLSHLVGFTSEEVAAVVASSKRLKRRGDAVQARLLDSVAEKIQSLAPDKDRRKLALDLDFLLELEGYALRPGPKIVLKDEVVLDLRAAVREFQEVRLDYRKRWTGERTRPVVRPYGFLYGTRPYLVAELPDGGEFRIYSVANIDAVERLGRDFQRREDFSLEAFAARSFGIWQEKPMNVVWRFSRKIADEARNFHFHPTQTFKEEPDGSVLVKFRCGGMWEMCWHAFTWGDGLEIVAPAKLRRMFQEQLKACGTPTKGSKNG